MAARGRGPGLGPPASAPRKVAPEATKSISKKDAYLPQERIEGEVLAPTSHVGELLPLAEAAGLPCRRFQLPDNVYGGVAIIGILRDWRKESFDSWLFFCGEAWIRLLLSHFIQILSMIGLWQLTVWQREQIEQEDCFAMQTWLLVVCLWIFIMHILTEIVAAIDMVELVLLQVPTVTDFSPLLYAKNDEGELELKDGGMTYSRKAFIFAAVLLPRVLIGTSLLIIGGLFLQTSTSNTEIFMNSLAAAFVIDIDEMVFAFLTPAASKRLIEEIPPFDVPIYSKGEEPEYIKIWRRLHRFWGMFKIVISLVLVWIFYHTSPPCPVSPGTDSECIFR